MVARSAPLPDWLAALEARAPDLVASFADLAEGRPLALRRGLQTRAGEGSVARVLPQHAAIADAYAAHLDALPDAALSHSGGEEGWTVARALGHAFEARSGLVTAASLAAQGRFPADAPTVVPGVPGPPEASRDELRKRLAASQRLVERAARSVAGHETEPCPLDHPLVGRLRCGEWFLFAGIHDLMHLEQLDGLAGTAPDGNRP
ncbi:MAG TPA: DinB family protein [Patescibacteria group bacterium]|nr:DinB family protein [Patescibacteria group bacterium]